MKLFITFSYSFFFLYLCNSCSLFFLFHFFFCLFGSSFFFIMSHVCLSVSIFWSLLSFDLLFILYILLLSFWSLLILSDLYYFSFFVYLGFVFLFSNFLADGLGSLFEVFLFLFPEESFCWYKPLLEQLLLHLIDFGVLRFHCHLSQSIS